MGKKRKRRKKKEIKGEVQWVRRWRSVVREGKEEVLGVANGLCAGRWWSEVMEEERGYAAGGCNSETRQKKMGEKRKRRKRKKKKKRRRRKKKVCRRVVVQGEEEEEEERNRGREGGWRCRWRWVLRGRVDDDAGGEKNDDARQTMMERGDRGESVLGGGLMEMRGAAAACVWELLRESGREMKIEDCDRGSRGILR
ncbi:hypothetical protein AAC387_Pa01g2826 [Persea americana]